MSAFLQRLVARSHAPVGTLRPRQRSAFEPWPGEGIGLVEAATERPASPPIVSDVHEPASPPGLVAAPAPAAVSREAKQNPAARPVAPEHAAPPPVSDGAAAREAPEPTDIKANTRGGAVRPRVEPTLARAAPESAAPSATWPEPAAPEQALAPSLRQAEPRAPAPAPLERAHASPELGPAPARPPHDEGHAQPVRQQENDADSSSSDASTPRPGASPPALRNTFPATIRPQVVVAVPEREEREAPGEAPTIHVSIGRVEVRAVSPPKPRRRAERPAPLLSLDDYLKRHRRSG